MLFMKKKEQATNEFDQVVIGNSLSKEAWKRLKKNKMAVIGLVVVIVYSILAASAGILPIYPYEESVLEHQNLRPTFTKTSGELMYEQKLKETYAKAWKFGTLKVDDETNALLEYYVEENSIAKIWDILYDIGQEQLANGEFEFTSRDQKSLDKMQNNIDTEIQASIKTVFYLDENGKKINLKKADYQLLKDVYTEILGLDLAKVEASIEKELNAQVSNKVKNTLDKPTDEELASALATELKTMDAKDFEKLGIENVYGKIEAHAKKLATKLISKQIEADSVEMPYKGEYEVSETLIADIEVNLKHERLYILGTDYLGRDLLSRIIYGGQISIAIGLIGTVTSVILGILVGAVAGYVGGKVDYYLMRFVDIMYGLPYMLLVIILMALVGREISTLFFALALVSWLTVARMVRGQVMSLKNQEYVEAARSMGGSTLHIILKHMVPNAFSVIIVYSTIRVPAFIMQESFLSFLGLGVQAPFASWGSLIGDGSKLGTMTTYPWQLVAPSVVMILFLVSMNFLGDGLRDAFDPQSKNQL